MKPALKKSRPLNPFQLWMVKSNLAAITAGETTATARIAELTANGYPNIADAVKAALS